MKSDWCYRARFDFHARPQLVPRLQRPGGRFVHQPSGFSAGCLPVGYPGRQRRAPGVATCDSAAKRVASLGATRTPLTPRAWVPVGRLHRASRAPPSARACTHRSNERHAHNAPTPKRRRTGIASRSRHSPDAAVPTSTSTSTSCTRPHATTCRRATPKCAAPRSAIRVAAHSASGATQTQRTAQTTAASFARSSRWRRCSLVMLSAQTRAGAPIWVALHKLSEERIMSAPAITDSAGHYHIIESKPLTVWRDYADTWLNCAHQG